MYDIYQRGKEGIWWTKKTRHNGSIIHRSLDTTDERIARARSAELWLSVERGDYQQNITKFEDCVDQYLNELSSDTKANRDRYRPVAIRFLDLFKGRIVGRITVADVLEYKLAREAKGIVESTLKKELRVLRRIIKLGNPGFKWPKVEEFPLMRFAYKGTRVTRYLELDELNRIISFAEEWLKPVVVLAAFTGMNKGEMLTVTWDEMNLFTGKVIKAREKTGVQRRIPIAEPLAEVLKVLNRFRRLDDKRVFPDISISRIDKGWRRAKKKSGITWPRFHDLRHFFGSFLRRSGVAIDVICDLMGHTDIKTTMRYGRIDDGQRELAIKTFNCSQSVPKSNF